MTDANSLLEFALVAQVLEFTLKSGNHHTMDVSLLEDMDLGMKEI
jgi:hypothetical protein